MDITRARQIFFSEQNHQVLLGENPVWIEGFKDDDRTARVRMLDGNGSIREVPVTELVEG